MLQVPLAHSLARRLQRSHQAVIDASDAERRRIAADLHDGVVQDVAGVAFGLASHDEESASRLRQAVRDLRTLLVEIHPPSLDSAGLEPALSDLLSPLQAAGMTTSLSVEGAPTGNDALVYRVAREALRNVTKHAGPRRRSTSSSPAGGSRSQTTAAASTPPSEEARQDAGHVGLAFLEEAVTRAGGRLEVQFTARCGHHGRDGAELR